jgi:hypothetical protein
VDGFIGVALDDVAIAHVIDEDDDDVGGGSGEGGLDVSKIVVCRKSA